MVNEEQLNANSHSSLDQAANSSVPQERQLRPWIEPSIVPMKINVTASYVQGAGVDGSPIYPTYEAS